MQEITPEQRAHLETWAGQRDLLLSEISNLQTQKELLLSDVKNIATSYTDVETRANQIIGRIEELAKKEKEMAFLTPKEIADLEKRKSVLQTEVGNLEKIIVELNDKKISLEKDVFSALSNFNVLKDEALILDKLVNHVTVVSDENVRKVEALVSSLSKSIEEIIAVNKKNVLETNIVIEKVPKMIMEAQKHGLIKNRI